MGQSWALWFHFEIHPDDFDDARTVEAKTTRTPITPPPTEDDDDMALFAYYVLPPTELKGSPELVVVNASVRYRNNSDANGVIPSIRFERATHGDQYETLLRTVKLA